MALSSTEIDSFSSIPALFNHFVEEAPTATFVHVPTNSSGRDYRSCTREEARKHVILLARKFAQLGVTSGTRVAIWANTRAEWCWVDMAVLSLGGIVVGIYPSLSRDVVLEQLNMCTVELLIVERESQYIDWEEEIDSVQSLQFVLSIEQGRECVSIQSFMEAEVNSSAAEELLGWYQQQLEQVQGNQCARIVFTSGSTGNSKGVMLTHRNFLANLRDTQIVLPLHKPVRSIVCLPLAHSLQRFVVYRAFVEDIEGYFAPSLDVLKAVIEETGPTVLIAVPRMLEKIQTAILLQVHQRFRLAESLLNWALEVAWRYRTYLANGRPVSRRISLQYQIAERIVLSKIRKGLGGALEQIICGGAPLSDKTARFFWSLGISVVEGWGLSETCAPATLNTEGVRKLGSVGRALPGFSIVVSKESELLIRGEGLFQGYWGERDSGCWTHDGYFRTGDVGVIDGEGYVWVTGRLKEILVTAGGKNIAPRRIEERLTGGLIEHSIVVGDTHPYLVALISLDELVLRSMAHQEGWVGTLSEWRKHPVVLERVQQRVDSANQTLASFEQIKRYTIVPLSFSEENGLLTTTQKIRRAAIVDHFSESIVRLYAP